MNILENTTIALRPPEPEDLDLLYLWENNPGIWHLSGTLAPFSRYVLKQYLKQAGKDIHETKQLRLMIIRRENHRPLGAIDLFDFDPHHRRAGVGILIADPSDRRKGYAREALETLKKYCRDVLQLHQLYCNIAGENQASMQLFTSQGFEPVGEKKEWLRMPDGFHSEWLLQCILQKGQ